MVGLLDNFGKALFPSYRTSRSSPDGRSSPCGPPGSSDARDAVAAPRVADRDRGALLCCWARRPWSRPSCWRCSPGGDLPVLAMSLDLISATSASRRSATPPISASAPTASASSHPTRRLVLDHAGRRRGAGDGGRRALRAGGPARDRRVFLMITLALGMVSGAGPSLGHAHQATTDLGVPRPNLGLPWSFTGGSPSTIWRSPASFSRCSCCAGGRLAVRPDARGIRESESGCGRSAITCGCTSTSAS